MILSFIHNRTIIAVSLLLLLTYFFHVEKTWPLTSTFQRNFPITLIFDLDKHSVQQIFLETNQNKSIWPKNTRYLFQFQTFSGLQSNILFQDGWKQGILSLLCFQVQYMERDVLLKCICNFCSALISLYFKIF